MNSKYLIILLLVIILVLVVLKNKKEFFQATKSTSHDNIKCNQKDDKKYVIFYPKDSKNARAIACNVTHYDKSLEMFQFESSKKPSIAVKIDNKLYKITITCKIRGSGPVFTGKNWALTALGNDIILDLSTRVIKFPRKTKDTFIELGYDNFEKVVKLRIDKNDLYGKEEEVPGLEFGRFDIGKDSNGYFNGFIGFIEVKEDIFKVLDVKARAANDFDKLLNFLLKIDPEGFKNYSNSDLIEHFQGRLEKPTNFNIVKVKHTDDTELSFLENKVKKTFGEFEAAAKESNAVKLSKVLINIGTKFIKSAISKKMDEYKNFASVVKVPKLKCRDNETLEACFYFSDKIDIPAFKFQNNPIDGALSIKSKLESFISQALSAELVKDYLNKSPDKKTILEDIKTKINETLKELQNRFSDAFFVYFELDYSITKDDYTFFLKKTVNSAPQAFMGKKEEASDKTTETETKDSGELYPDNDFIKRVEDCNINFRAHGASKSACIKTCMDNRVVNKCDFDTCFNICEKCENKSYCRWLQDRNQNVVNQACNFDANEDNTSTTEYECISLCKAEGNSSCTQNICKNTCSRCSNEDTCPWVREAREFASDLRNIDYPSPPIVTGVPGDRKITLKWNISSTGGAEIEKFIFMVFKTGNHSEGMRVETAVNSVQNIGGGFYTHTIETLENGVNYTVSLAAVNKRGLSAMSKPLVLKPFKFEDEIKVENTLESNNIIQMQRDQLVSDIVSKIEKNDYNNLQNEINEVRKIEESLEQSKGKDLFSQLKKIRNLNLSVNN